MEEQQTAAGQGEVVLKVKQVCGAKWTGDVSISLDATAADLKSKLQNLTGQPLHTMKLMCSGKILKNELSLKEQRVGSTKASSMLMLMEDLAGKKMELEQTEQQKILDETQVERTLAAAQDLASRVDTDENEYAPQTLEIYNQSGQKMHLLPSTVFFVFLNVFCSTDPTWLGDQRALTVGMTLHDRGKALVKKGDLKTAAQMFLRAESEGFSKCSADLLAMVDNYGLLCLDIAWTYFKLQDINNLKDAGWRLQKAQECLEKTYGRNMERLKRLKGGAPEMILYVRLNLLRAIAAYHNNDSAGAQRYLNEAETKLNSLKVTDDELVGLIAMGFSATVTYLINKREQQRAAREEERRQREARRERHRAGRTANGQWVDVALLKALTDMGFTRRLATEALRQSNNDEAASITLLTESPDVLQASIDASRNKKSKRKATLTPVPEDKIEQVVGMGFSRAQAVGTLRATDANVEQAINLLLEGRGIEADDEPVATTTTTTEAEAGAAMEVEHKGEAPGTDEAAAAAAAEAERKREQEERLAQERELQRQTENELLDSVEEDADAHLDIPLDDEFAVLGTYKQLLLQQQSPSS
ncbi:UBA/TS-N domain containing protein [Acanthamoeba castellanii str. Neff]|uniref:UBA/TS-N domain containing protein n=1 Tax=Acanthamoeba castellanii (strain ATCC 30010 / Neff) TaxID=1257118 RepID=L8GF49_ACACF|nr:UBA/TS-N domain containing protein [Acanthamoeba castellanii str. Neff]ELR11499.1 UBA/TS-N domain containing protein [Acanthamoeba castellanii str. Neff]